MKKLFVGTALALAVAALGCSSNDDNGGSEPDAANGVDANGNDTSVHDTAKDTTTPPDTTKDTAPDVVADTTPDTKPDTPPDVVADSPVDTTPDAAVDTTPDAVADTVDASDAACPAGEWRDFSTGGCTSCGDATIFVGCSDLDFTTSSWDDASSTIHIELNPGVAQITSAVVHYADYTGSTSAIRTATAVVTGNDIAAVLVIDSGTTSVNIGSIDVTEACGGSSSPATDINLVPTAGGTGYTATFGCAL